MTARRQPGSHNQTTLRTRLGRAARAVAVVLVVAHRHHTLRVPHADDRARGRARAHGDARNRARRPSGVRALERLHAGRLCDGAAVQGQSGVTGRLRHGRAVPELRKRERSQGRAVPGRRDRRRVHRGPAGRAVSCARLQRGIAVLDHRVRGRRLDHPSQRAPTHGRDRTHRVRQDRGRLPRRSRPSTCAPRAKPRARRPSTDGSRVSAPRIRT